MEENTYIGINNMVSFHRHIWLCIIVILLLSCANTEHKTIDERHYIIYRNQGYTTKMFFHDKTNPYIAKIIKYRKQFILVVTDTILNQKYILKSDESIIIIGGDIKYKIYGRETFY